MVSFLALFCIVYKCLEYIPLFLIAFPSFYFAKVGLIFSYVGQIANAIFATFIHPLTTIPSKCRNIVQYSDKRQIHLDSVSICTFCRKSLHQIIAILYSISQSDLYDIWTFFIFTFDFLTAIYAKEKLFEEYSLFFYRKDGLALMLSGSTDQS